MFSPQLLMILLAIIFTIVGAFFLMGKRKEETLFIPDPSRFRINKWER